MIGKAGVEAAKKAIPMAGQKLSEFFTKEVCGIHLKKSCS